MKIPTCNSQNLLGSSFIYSLATTIYFYLILYYWLQYVGEEIGARWSTRFVEVNSSLRTLLAMIYRLIKNALFPMNICCTSRSNQGTFPSCNTTDVGFILFSLYQPNIIYYNLFFQENELKDCVNHLFCGSLGQLRRQRDFFIVFL